MTLLADQGWGNVIRFGVILFVVLGVFYFYITSGPKDDDRD
jgi:hypothetical protein